MDLFLMYLDHSPWNYETDYANGNYIVVAKPLYSSSSYPNRVEVVKTIFTRLKNTSFLYAAQLKASQLNQSPSKALNLTDGQTVEGFVLDKIRAEIGNLPKTKKTRYEEQLTAEITSMSKMKDTFGDRVFLLLGDLDLKIKVQLGQITFKPGERQAVEEMLVDAISGVVEGRRDGIKNVEETYMPERWEKICKHAFNRALHFGLSKEEKDRIEFEMKPDALNRTKALLTQVFGPEMMIKVITIIETIETGGPLSLEDYKSFINRKLEYQIKDLNDKEWTLLDHHNLLNSLADDDDGITSNICNSWIYEPVRDQVTGKSIILSAFSAKHYEVGLGIIVHEMAHAASFAIDLLKRKGEDITPFEDVRACISENYQNSDRPATYEQSQFNADKLWTEEDWADAFAGYAMRDQPVNYMCSLLGSNPYRNDYATMSERDGDTHSPNFYRILNTSTHLGQTLPSQCEAPLKDKYSETKFKDCLSIYGAK